MASLRLVDSNPEQKVMVETCVSYLEVLHFEALMSGQKFSLRLLGLHILSRKITIIVDKRIVI
jgi:hypothetical protein